MLFNAPFGVLLIHAQLSPEAILGGPADFNDDPGRFAIRTDDGQLASVLAPQASVVRRK